VAQQLSEQKLSDVTSDMPKAWTQKPILNVPSSAPVVRSRRVSPCKSAFRGCFNRVLHLLARVLPGASTVRPFLHRLRGVSVGQNVSIGDDVYIENEYPESVEIQDGAMIGLRSTIVAHTRGAGKITIGRNAFIGTASVLLTSGSRALTIGEGAVLMAASVVTTDVPPYTLYGMERARPLGRVTKAFTAETSYDDFIASLRPLKQAR
jgi:acetyltransferase-like isoleucine patch superfamily enzyme